MAKLTEAHAAITQVQSRLTERLIELNRLLEVGEQEQPR